MDQLTSQLVSKTLIEDVVLSFGICLVVVTDANTKFREVF